MYVEIPVETLSTLWAIGSIIIHSSLLMLFIALLIISDGNPSVANIPVLLLLILSFFIHMVWGEDEKFMDFPYKQKKGVYDSKFSEDITSTKSMKKFPLLFNAGDKRVYTKDTNNALISIDKLVENGNCRNCEALAEANTLVNQKNSMLNDTLYCYLAINNNEEQEVYYSLGEDIYLTSLLTQEEK